VRTTQICHSSNMFKITSSMLKATPLGRVAKQTMVRELSSICQVNEKPRLVERPLKRLNLISSYQTRKIGSEDTLNHIGP
jgi:hypothetical protein